MTASKRENSLTKILGLDITIDIVDIGASPSGGNGVIGASKSPTTELYCLQ
jgi:hypothetical protein